MTIPNNKKMQEKLIALREELELITKMSDDASQVVELDQAKVGRLSRMDAMQAQAMSQAAGRRREAMLKAIDMALKRIDDDAFGDCQSCGEPISAKRLEFDPTARFCIECATKKEQGRNS